MNLINIPKVLILDISDLVTDISNYTIIVNETTTYKFDPMDVNNILMDIIRNVDESGHGVVIGLLKIYHLLDSSTNPNKIVNDLHYFFDQLKLSLIEKIHVINLDRMLSAESGKFNFYLRELRGNNAILEYLSGVVK